MLTQLILQHCPQLTTRTMEQACAQVAWFRTLAPTTLERMFTEDYQQLAQMLQTNDVGMLRTYIEQTGQARLQMGAPAESLIAAAVLMEENLRRLIDAELAPYPLAARDATRRVQTAIRNVRMILSGLNLRRLTSERFRST
jgi:hypothetical protein